MPLRVGFFRDFKTRDTLLLDGDRDALRQLADTCRRVAHDGSTIALHDLPFVEVHHGLRIIAIVGPRHSGATVNGVDIHWERSKSGWLDTVEKLEALAGAAVGHQYLDAIKDLTQVMASSGEYDNEWWARNG